MQIVTGDVSINKKHHLIKKMWEVHQDNLDATLFYVVPEHLKFDMENEVLSELQAIQGKKEAATFKIQVVSIKRLGWYLLDRASQGKTHLTETGNLMIIKQVLMEHSDQLLVYKGQEKHLGFAEKLNNLFDELIQGNIRPDDLVDTSLELDLSLNHGHTDLPNMEERRMLELKMLYEAYLSRMESEGFESFQIIDRMIEWLSHQGGNLPYYFFFDHHDYFNAKEFQLLVHLERQSRGVWISLPLTHQQTKSNQWNPVVTVAQNTYKRIKELSHLFEFKLEPNWDIAHPTYDYDPDLLKAVRQYQVVQVNGKQVEKMNEKTPVAVRQYVTPQEEIKDVANRIHEAVKTRGYQYKEIRVLTRDLGYYQQFLDAYFSANRIPYFIDNQSQMAQSSLVGLLEGIFQLKLTSWSYPALMKVIKSHLIVPPWLQDDLEECHHQKSAFENFLLSNGFFSYRFYSSAFQWHFPGEETTFINHLGKRTEMSQGQVFSKWREWILNVFGVALAEYQEKISGNQAAEWLYHLLEKSQIKDRMMHLRDKSIESGDLGQSKKLEQVWQVLVETLDEFFLLYQEKEISFNDFQEILLSGLSTATYHIIPPTLDQVTITSIESPQVKPAKLVFVLGLNHHVLPQYKQADSLLSQSNRSQIQAGLLAHQYLMDKIQVSNLNESFIAYKTLLSASQELYLSYASNVEGQQMNLSPLINQWIKATGLKIESVKPDEERLDGEWQVGQLGRPSLILSNLLASIRKSFYHHEAFPAINQSLLAWVMEEVKESREVIKKIFNFHQLPIALNRHIAKQLYGERLSMSASRLELYYQDPFSHFLQYGLRLKERQVFQISPARTGEYYHHILDLVLKQIPQLSEVEPHVITQTLEEVIKGLEGDIHYHLFQSSPRLRAIKGQMDFQIGRFLDFSRLQSFEIGPLTLKTEALFGMGNQSDFEFLSYQLEGGQEVRLRGKIDRIDQVGEDGLIQIIDYKSGQKKFEVQKFYVGLDLQLMTYLQVALNHYADLVGKSQDTMPLTRIVGSFYQPLVQKYRVADQKLINSLNQNTGNQNYLLEENRLNGFIGIDEVTLIAIDPNVKEDKYSLVYPANITSKGKYHTYTPYWDTEVLRGALKHTQNKIIQAANEILDGNIEIQPYKDLRQFTLSLMPDYRVISGFDATVHSHQYRYFTDDKQSILEYFREIGEEKKGGKPHD